MERRRYLWSEHYGRKRELGHGRHDSSFPAWALICNTWLRQPTAAERLVECEHGLQTRQPCGHAIILGGEQRLLRDQYRHEVHGALAQPGLGDLEGAP